MALLQANPSSISSSKRRISRFPWAALACVAIVAAGLALTSRVSGYSGMRKTGLGSGRLDYLIHQVENYSAPSEARDILVLGDSTTMVWQEDETIPQILQRTFSEGGMQSLHVQSFLHPRLHMAHFYVLASRLVEKKPVALVVCFNLCTLSPPWFEGAPNKKFPVLAGLLPFRLFLNEGGRLAWGLDVPLRDLLGYQILFKTHAAGYYFFLEGWRTQVREELHKWVARRMGKNSPPPAKNNLSQGDRTVRLLREQLPYLRGVAVQEEDKTLHFAKMIQELGNERGVPVLFYISPVNGPQAMRDGVDLKPIVGQLEQTLRKNSMRFVNLWNLLDEDCFNDRFHFNSKGGAMVAKALGEEICRMLKDSKESSPATKSHPQQ